MQFLELPLLSLCVCLQLVFHGEIGYSVNVITVFFSHVVADQQMGGEQVSVRQRKISKGSWRRNTGIISES